MTLSRSHQAAAAAAAAAGGACHTAPAAANQQAQAHQHWERLLAQLAGAGAEGLSPSPPPTHPRAQPWQFPLHTYSICTNLGIQGCKLTACCKTTCQPLGSCWLGWSPGPQAWQVATGVAIKGAGAAPRARWACAEWLAGCLCLPITHDPTHMKHTTQHSWHPWLTPLLLLHYCTAAVLLTPVTLGDPAGQPWLKSPPALDCT